MRNPTPDAPLETLSLEQLTVIISRNLDFAVTCTEVARQVIEEGGNEESLLPGTGFAAVEEEIRRALHFTQLAQRYLELAKQRTVREVGETAAGEPGAAIASP